MKESRAKNVNVLLLSVASCFLYTACNTTNNIQTVLITNAQNSSSSSYMEGFSGNGFYSMAIICATSTFTNRLAPSANSLLGLKGTLIFSSIMIALFIATFFYLVDALLYTGSVLLGLGNAMFFPSQDAFLSLNSDETTIARNAGIFWGLFFSNHLLGNGIIYFLFDDIGQIDNVGRRLYASIMLCITLIGMMTLVFLRPTPWADTKDAKDKEAASATSAWAAFRKSFSMFARRDMAILLPFFTYMGLQVSMGVGVYGTCLGFTRNFVGSNNLPFLKSILFGIGGIACGLFFGNLGRRINKASLVPGMLLGIGIEFAGFAMIFVNIPNSAPLGPTNEEAFLSPSNKVLALIPGFCLGFGDACLNTQSVSLLRRLHPEDPAPAFALFRFVQAVFSTTAFFCAGSVPLYYQLGALVLLGTAGAVVFGVVERLFVVPRLN